MATIPPRAILAPTDLSEHSRPAVKAAFQLAEHFGAELHLLHVLADVVPIGPDPTLISVMPPEFYAESEQKSLEMLNQFVHPDWPQPRSLVKAVVWGNAVEAIVEYARNHPIDLIVISTHGRTGLSHVLLGSVAERIVREAPCPVMTIRSQT